MDIGFFVNQETWSVVQPSSFIVHSYGIINGLMLASFVFLLLLSLSMTLGKQRHYAGANFLLAAVAFGCFGLFNLFVQSVNFNSLNQNFANPALVNAGKYALPIGMILTAFIFQTHLLSQSLFSYQRSTNYRRAIWGLYVIDAIGLLALTQISSPSASLFMLTLMLIPNIGLLAHFYITFKSNTNSKIVSTAVLVTVTSWMIFAGIHMFWGQTPHEGYMLAMHLVSASALLFISFHIIMAGHELSVRFFDVYEMDQKNLLGGIFKAIDSNQFYLVYQPKLDLKNDKIVGLEALIRWRHPKHGNVSPDDFIRLAEKTGLIDSICRWTIDAAVTQAKLLMDSGYDLQIAVNFSAINVNASIVEHMKQSLEQKNVPASRIMVEITESLFIDMSQEQKNALEDMYRMGIPLALDDYGTGFSSLSHINKLRLNQLKVDRSFVHNLDVDAGNYVIVQSTLQMSHSLGIEVVAEGVETEKVANILKGMGCDQIQGYYLCKPLTSDRLLSWLHKKRFHISSFETIEPNHDDFSGLFKSQQRSTA